jgi:tRNA-splicing ligase RtcB
MGLEQVYDVAHNTAMLERHTVAGTERTVLIHRKGATRSFGPGRTELPAVYRETGQPVILGGSMETGSYLLAGTQESASTFHTTAHGSGRTMSRTKAKQLHNGRELQRTLEQRGIYIRTASFAGLVEEAGDAYKNIDDVVEAVSRAGLSRPVVGFTPLGSIKG